MTRNFNQYERDNERPHSRSSSNRYEGEGASRPARTRPNRASVDRAWENGARQQHPDYRPRGANNTRGTSNSRPTRNGYSTTSRSQGQPYQSNRRPYSRDDASSSSANRGYRKPPYSREENRRYDDRPPRRYGGGRPVDSDRRASGERFSGNRPRYERNDEQRPSYRDQERTSRARPYSSRRDDERGGAPRRSGGYNRFDREPTQYRRTQGAYRRDSQDTRGSRNPRSQSMPERSTRQPRQFERQPDRNDHALFEGDYERFDAGDNRPVERHVTQLPDGRVLKGSRKAQREAASFWTGVDQEAQELLADVSDVEEQPAAQPQTKSAPAKHPGVGEKRTRKAPVSGTAGKSGAAGKGASSAKGEPRAKKASTKPKSAKPLPDSPRPSQRGYKWPKPE